MTEAGTEHARIAFPATAEFASVGRVAVAGIALRLGIDVGQVESLRLAVSTSIEALAGDGTVTLLATWNDDSFELELTNPDAPGLDASELAGRLDDLGIPVTVSPNKVTLLLSR